MAESQSRFEIEIDEEISIGRDDIVAHSEHGPMVVDRITIGTHGKRARLMAELREDRMSVELTGDEIREAWGETLALDPFELTDVKTKFSQDLASKDGEIEITLKVAGPEEDAEPVMAHLHDQAVRVLGAIENQKPPEECDGSFNINWDGIFSEDPDDV